MAVVVVVAVSGAFVASPVLPNAFSRGGEMAIPADDVIWWTAVVINTDSISSKLLLLLPLLPSVLDEVG